MATTLKKLAQLQLTGGTDTLYTVPASTTTLIKTIHVVNASGSVRTVKLGHDGSADSNLILPTISIDAGGFAQFDGEITMETGDTLVAIASAASAITVTVHGVEFA